MKVFATKKLFFMPHLNKSFKKKNNTGNKLLLLCLNFFSKSKVLKIAMILSSKISDAFLNILHCDNEEMFLNFSILKYGNTKPATESF